MGRKAAEIGEMAALQADLSVNESTIRNLNYAPCARNDVMIHPGVSFNFSFRDHMN